MTGHGSGFVVKMPAYEEIDLVVIFFIKINV